MSDVKTDNDIILVEKGANKVLDNIDEAFSHLKKNYNAEGASGFYTIKDSEIAKAYAYKFTELGEIPYINYYKLNVGGIERDLKTAYYDTLNDESIRYLSDNLNEVFPEYCRWFETSVKPRDVCHECKNEMCNRNASYIRAILSDNVTYSLDDILIKVTIGELTEDEARELINDRLRQYNSPIRIQIILRKDAKDYIEFDHYRPLPRKTIEDEKKYGKLL